MSCHLPHDTTEMIQSNNHNNKLGITRYYIQFSKCKLRKWFRSPAREKQLHNCNCMDRINRVKMGSYCIFIATHTIHMLIHRPCGQNFADDIFKCIFLNENVWISIAISLKFIPKGQINNIPALVHIMAWPYYLNQWWLVYYRIYASLGLNEIMHAMNSSFVYMMPFHVCPNWKCTVPASAEGY